jgi:hypothetical protein
MNGGSGVIDLGRTPAQINVKITAAQHEAALKAPRRPGAVIYKQGGKLYMMEDNAGEAPTASGAISTLTTEQSLGPNRHNGERPCRLFG